MRRHVFPVLALVIILSLVLAGFGCKPAASTTTSQTTTTKAGTTAATTARTTATTTAGTSATTTTRTTTTTTTSKPPAAPIKIGVMEDASGANSYWGQAFLEGAKVAIQMVNDSGGIKSLGGAKIEAVYGVGDSTIPTMLNELERLITVEKVSAIVGPTITSGWVAAAPVAEKYQIPIAGGPNLVDLFNKGYKYVFSTGVPAANLGRQKADFIDWLIKNHGAPSDRMAALTSTPSYTSVRDSAVSRLAELGLPKLVLQEEVPVSITDFTSIVLKLKAANVSMLLLDLTSPSNVPFYQAAYALDYHPWLITAGAGFGTSLRDALPAEIAKKELPRPNHFMAGTGIVTDSYTTIPSIKAFYELSKKLFPNSKSQYPDTLSGGGQPMLALVQAIENAASRNPVDIANAFRKLTISAPSPYLVYANQYPTLQISQTGQVSTGTIEAAQWSDDMQALNTVWPPASAKTKPRAQK